MAASHHYHLCRDWFDLAFFSFVQVARFGAFRAWSGKILKSGR
jgi:hypothetical protein